MANYASLLATIANNITDNNSGAITGPILKSVLDSMVGSLGTGYQFMGVATTSTNPGTPDQKVYYLAGPGTYTNFNGLVVADGEIAILKYDSAWSKVTTPIASADEVSQLGQQLIHIDTTSIDASSIPSCGGRINNGKWTSQYANQYYGGLVDITAYRGQTIKIVAGGNSSGGGSFTFTQNGFVNNQNVQYATGWSSSYLFPSAGAEWEGEIPEDAVYLYVYLQSPGVSYRPQSIEVKQETGIWDYLAAMQDEIDNINNDVVMGIDMSSVTSCGGRIASGSWTTQYADEYYAGLIDVTQYRGKAYKIVAGGTSSGGGSYAFLKSGMVAGQSADWATGWSGVQSMTMGQEYTGVVPDDATYLYVYLMSQTTSYAPQSIAFTIPLEQAIEDLEKDVDSAKQERLSLMTYNIGHFSLGVQKNSTITSAQYPTKVDGFRALLSTKKPDIFGVVEYSAVFGKNASNVDVNTKDELFNFQKTQFESSQMNYACYALFGGDDVPLYNVKINDFDCLANETITHTTAITAQDYRYISADLYAFGVSIKLVITHLAFDTNRPGVLQAAQFTELINKYATAPYVIVTGDFNLNVTGTNYDVWTNAGYTLANDGSFKTYPSGGTALDNIMVKGLRIGDVAMIQSALSDHYPLVCEVFK